MALRRFTQPMTLAEAEQYLETVSRPIAAVHSSSALYSEALTLDCKHCRHGMTRSIVAAAIEAGCKVLYSEDLQSGRLFGDLRIENPFA